MMSCLHRWLGIGLVALWLSGSPPAHAQVIGESLEWLTEVAPSIGVYELVSIDSTRGPYYFGFDSRCVNCIKGACPKSLSHVAYFESPPLPGERVLVFRGEDWADTAVVLLSRPDLQPGMALDRRFNVLHGEEEILALVRQQMERRRLEHAPLVRYEPGLLYEIPDSTEAFRALYVGKASYLAVPPDQEEFEKLQRILRTRGPGLEWAVCALGALYPQYARSRIVYDHIPPERKFTWIHGHAGRTDTLEVPMQVALQRSLSKRWGVEFSDPYTKFADFMDACDVIHSVRRRDEN